jgi:hypothetical protein
MFKFAEYLMEAAKKAKKEKPKEFNVNDAKGKLYEILTGSHLQHGTHKDGHPNKFLSHFRDEEGKTPQDVHDYIKRELDIRHPGMYNEISRHSRDAAHHIRGELARQGHHTIHETAWTSQAGDHNRFTGEEDPNSDADVMIKTNKGPVGLSLKYGGSKDMNLRNNGLESLETMSGLKGGEIQKERTKHQQWMQNAGVTSHEEYKRMRDEGTPKEKKLAAAADDSALVAQRNMAGHLTRGISQYNSDQLKDYVRERIAPKTKFQHFRVHTRPDASGASTHHMGDVQEEAKKLDNFAELRPVAHTGGISAKIEGRRHGSDRYEPILDQAIKKGSGPTKGFASATKAPFLSKSDAPKPTKTRASFSSVAVAPKPTKPKRVKPFKEVIAPAPVVRPQRKQRVRTPISKSSVAAPQSSQSLLNRPRPKVARRSTVHVPMGNDGSHGAVIFRGPGE